MSLFHLSAADRAFLALVIQEEKLRLLSAPGVIPSVRRSRLETCRRIESWMDDQVTNADARFADRSTPPALVDVNDALCNVCHHRVGAHGRTGCLTVTASNETACGCRQAARV